jgi:hypothetical protein
MHRARPRQLSVSLLRCVALLSLNFDFLYLRLRTGVSFLLPPQETSRVRFVHIDSKFSVMPLFKTRRAQTLVGTAVVFFLCLGIAVPAIIHQELFSRYDGRAKDAQYRAVERVASDVYVNWDTGLVPETEILSHVPGSSLQQSFRTEYIH